MPAYKPVDIPWPRSSFPGMTPQESAGRLINCHAEPLGPNGPAPQAYHRAPGLTQFGLAVTANVGYRGGLLVNNLGFEAWANNASTVDGGGNVNSLGVLPGTKKISIARNQNSAGADVVAVDIDNGAFVLETQPLANATATIAIGGTFTNGNVITFSLDNASVINFAEEFTHTLSGDTATTVAATFAGLINADPVLTAAGVAASSSGGNLTITMPGANGNATQGSFTQTGTGVTFDGLPGGSNFLAGGTGTPGISFTGAPVSLSTLTAAGFPQPLSVCWQDGFFFFMSATNELFASNINQLTFNALTFTVLQSKSDVTGMRAVAFSGVLWAFTSGGVEIWQDTAQPFPNFPYSRLVILPYGLLQTNAIAGWETGFDTLIWVSQDFGVWMAPYGASSLSPTKISPPDLDRLIEAQQKAGNLLEAFAYVFAGKRFWALSSPAWTWEFNVNAQEWNERTSFVASSGFQGRWRAVGGHPAFGKWLCGDTQSGALAFVDDTAITELGAPQLRRIESAPVGAFPNRLRVARADFYFSTGAGIALGATQNVVNPSVAISWSDDNGNKWSNPIVRSLGLQAESLRTRISVKNTGYSGPQARRWRVDDTDCNAPFVRATQSDNPVEY